MEEGQEWRVLGVPIVAGIAVGKVVFLPSSQLKVNELTLPQEEVEHEIRRYYRALKQSKLDLVALKKEVTEEQEVASILQAHLEIIKDPLLTEEVVNTIRKDRKNAEYAFSSIIGKIKESLGKGVVADRVQDIHDISNRVIGHLCRGHRRSLGCSDQNIIVFAEELAPSEVASANPAYIRGFVSLSGGATSHTAIVSKAKSIPYLASIAPEHWQEMQQYQGKLVLIDGIHGEIIFNPMPKTLEICYKKRSTVLSPITVCESSIPLRVSAHAGTPSDLDILREFFPDTSIGLFRSEFLAFEHLPTEEEQYIVYKRLMSFPNSVLRLFDFGEDKPCPGIHGSGLRSVRWLLANENVLKEQLRAILRASTEGCIRVLIPGVVDAAEIIAVKTLCHSLLEEGALGIGENIFWGSMIETPSSAWMIEEIMQQVRFLSIGTNDLIQYTLGNPREAPLPDYLNSGLHPSLIRTLKHVITRAKRRGIPVSICGEAASDTTLTSLFIGLGVTELSVAIPSIAKVREALTAVPQKATRGI